ncbi:MAG: hypothetical protein C0496_17920 [Erythrobacter sp.]|nr:hypothetical protein [Erythrobacter sp.]
MITEQHVAACIAGLSALDEETSRTGLGIRRQPFGDQGLRGIELRQCRRAWPVAGPGHIQLGIEQTFCNPTLQDLAMDAELAQRHALRTTLHLNETAQPHALTASVHTGSQRQDALECAEKDHTAGRCF